MKLHAPLRQGANVSTERDAPELRRALRARFRRANLFTIPSTVPTATLFVAMLWSHSSHRGLLVWWAVAIAQLAIHWRLHFRRPLGEEWEHDAALAQAASGIAWGLLPLVAMPDTVEWQIFLGALILGILASNALFGAAIREAFYAFLGPITVMSVSAFVWLGHGAGQWMTAFLVLYAALFSTVLAQISRVSDEDASSLAYRNGLLASELATESERLSAANEKLELQARYDPLTGLVNRAYFVECLTETLANPQGRERVAVLFIDLDQFKLVNDTMGHAVGDRLLSCVADRLKSTVDDDEMLARMGGDELTVMITCPEGHTASDGARRFLDAFDAPFRVDRRMLSVGASIGVVVEDGVSSTADLLRFADTALYRAKAKGRGRLEVFDTAMRLELENRSMLADELHSAVTGGQLTTYLQPIVDMSTGIIHGAEALSRWPHPTGLRTAGSYMDLAQELGLEARISREAIEAVNDFRLMCLPQAGAPWITVNVPPQQIGEMFRYFAETAQQLSGLTLEITETGAVDDIEQASQLLGAARAAGAKVLLDDFGVGQSSLSLLTELPLDGVKIDAAFVRHLTSSESARAVVSAIVELGRRMDLMVIAEGIETWEQADLLQELGVHLAQGFLFSGAMPFSQFEAVLSAGTSLSPSRQPERQLATGL